jgi:hypothetical protein
MMANNSVKQKACCVLESFMAGWGIRVQFSQGAGQGDMMVNEQAIWVEDSSAGSTDQHFTVSAQALASCRAKEQLNEIYRLTEYLGLGRPPVPKRFLNDDVVRSKGDDYESIAMRLNQFQRTVNPPAEVWARYMPILKREAKRAASRYRHVVSRTVSGHSPNNWEDLLSVAMIFFTNYWFKYAEKTNEGLNERFLTYFLHQQFSRWYTVSYKRLKNIDGCIPVLRQEASEMPHDEEEAVPATALLDQTKRRLKNDALMARLNRMPKDQKIQILRDIVESDFCDHTAKNRAREMLKEIISGTQKATSCLSGELDQTDDAPQQG